MDGLRRFKGGVCVISEGRFLDIGGSETFDGYGGDAAVENG